MYNNVLESFEEIKEFEESRVPSFREILKENEGVIPVIALHPAMFKGNYLVLDKYFRHDNHDLEIFHMPELTEEEYNEFVKVGKIKGEENLVFETASAYYKKKAQKYIISKDLGLDLKILSFAGYNTNELYYTYSSYSDSVRYAEEEWYREQDNEMPTSKELYIDMCGHKNTLDMDLYKELETVCLKLTKARLAMIFEVKKIVYILKDILEYTNGFAENITAEQSNSLVAAKNRLTKMLEDKELIEWITAGNTDYTLYAECEDTRSIYIKEYHDILSAWTGRGGEAYYKPGIHNEIDKYENLFFEENVDDISVNYIENRDNEGVEEEEYNYCYIGI